MRSNVKRRMVQASQTSFSDTGTLQITALTEQNLPVRDARVLISYTADPESTLEQLQTDSSGKTPVIDLSAPPLAYSLAPSEIQPYAEYTIQISAPGYEPLTVSGIEILSSQESLQSVRLRPLKPEEAPDLISIPEHTLYGTYPPKIAEAEIKPVSISGEIVLDQVVVPEYIVVHDGTPRDSSAPNYYVRYKDYIKNVASSEIYATWPYETICANILAIQSFTLNRVYTEWYHDPPLFNVNCLAYQYFFPLKSKSIFQNLFCWNPFCKQICFIPSFINLSKRCIHSIL